jgi:hypothetical protein
MCLIIRNEYHEVVSNFQESGQRDIAHDFIAIRSTSLKCSPIDLSFRCYFCS